MTWTPEQAAQRREWDLDRLDADTPTVTASYHRDLERTAARQMAREAAAIASNGHEPETPPEDVVLVAQRLSVADLVLNIADYRAAVPTNIPWRCRPLAYGGGVTLIAGPPKAGKSTLAAQLQRCAETGEDFLGSWPVDPGPCLLVTEEGGVAVVHKTSGLERLDVLDRRAALSAGLSYRQVLDVIAEWADANPNGTAFIDTLAIWAEIENENDASQANRAVSLVTSLAQATDLAVVLIHHVRKAAGEHGEAIRGSGAILATVDIAAEMSRVVSGSDERWLDVQGRVISPERFLLGFDRTSMQYRLEDRSDVRLEEIEAALVGVAVDGPGMTRNDLTALWGKDSRKRSEELVNVGRMRKTFVQQGRTSAFRYWAIPAAWTAPMEAFDD